MAHPHKKLKCQGKVIADNKKVIVVAIEEENEMEQIIIIYIHTFEGKP